uniref:Uncharacterized protein n=1 Tax=Populus trichocarpa TaxID=3694 RepID=A0A2K2C182_POPTR
MYITRICFRGGTFLILCVISIMLPRNCQMILSKLALSHIKNKTGTVFHGMLGTPASIIIIRTTNKH